MSLQLYLGSQIHVASNGDLSLGTANIISSVLDSRFQSEATRAATAENVLTTNLATEVTRANAAESVLTTNLDTEATRAKAAEQVLTTAVNAITNGSDLSSDSLIEIMNFAISVKTLEISDVTKLTSTISTEVTRANAAESVLTTNLATEVTRANAVENGLQQQINDIIIAPYSPLIWADGALPIPLSIALTAAGQHGWNYTNIVAPNGNYNYNKNKINWYMQNTPTLGVGKFNNLTIADIQELNFAVTLINVTSAPFLTIYTQVKNDGTDKKTWYNSKVTYTIDGDATNVWQSKLVNNEQYLFRASGINSGLTITPNSTCIGYTSVNLLPSVVSTSTTGSIISSDKIWGISIGTNSAANPGDVNFILKHFELKTYTKQNKKILFSNDSVLLGRLFANLFNSQDPSQL